MGKFKLTYTEIEDLYIIDPTVFGDKRGYFMETYNEEDFHELGLYMKFVQDNESSSFKGVLRGMHFQVNNPQGKLVRIINGEVFDVAVDMRKNSKTYGKWHGVYLSEENKRQFYVPEGFAHGFLVMSERATFVYKCTDFYQPKDERGFIWNDKNVNIGWPLSEIDKVSISEKDAALCFFNEI